MRHLPLALMLVSGVAAAPVPKETDEARWKRLLGAVVDPDADCKFVYGPDTFIVTVPDTPHEHTRSGIGNAPRTDVVAAGNFELVVRVTVRPTAGVWAAQKDRFPHAAAGLLVQLPDGKFVSLGRRLDRPSRDAGWEVQTEFRSTPGEKVRAFSTVTTADDGKPMYLRVRRSGGEMTAHASPDGKTWAEVGKFDLGELSGKLTVGVYAEHNSAGEFVAEFAQFAVGKP